MKYLDGRDAADDDCLSTGTAVILYKMKPKCCCQLFPLTLGVYMIAFHCLIQGAYGVFLVLTTKYRPPNELLNNCTIASNASLLPTAICIVWANLYQSSKGVVCCTVLIIFVALGNFITSIFYFVVYIAFRANSHLDKDFFWDDISDWVSYHDLPFTLWHIFAIILILIPPLFWYYAYVLCKLAIYLKLKASQNDPRYSTSEEDETSKRWYKRSRKHRNWRTTSFA